MKTKGGGKHDVLMKEKEKEKKTRGSFLMETRTFPKQTKDLLKKRKKIK